MYFQVVTPKAQDSYERIAYKMKRVHVLSTHVTFWLSGQQSVSSLVLYWSITGTWSVCFLLKMLQIFQQRTCMDVPWNFKSPHMSDTLCDKVTFWLWTLAQHHFTLRMLHVKLNWPWVCCLTNVWHEDLLNFNES